MSNTNFRTLLEKHTLNGHNYLEWRRNLKIVLRFEKLSHVLDEPYPEAPAEGATQAVMNRYERAHEAYESAYCIMLGSMDSEHQKQCENMNAHEMNDHLQRLYEGHARNERFNVTRELFSLRMKESDSLETHGVRIIGLFKR